MPSASLRALIRALPEPHVLVDREGGLIGLNHSAERLFGVRSDELGSMRLGDLLVDPPEHVDELLRRCSGSGTLLPGTVHVRDAGGSVMAFRCDGGVARPESARRPTVLLFRFREQERSSERFSALNRRIQALDRERFQAVVARADAEREAQRTSGLQRVTAALSEALTFGRVSEVIVEEGVRVLAAATGAIALLDAEGEALEVAHVVGVPPELVERWRRYPLSDATPLGRAVLTGEPVFIEGAEHWACFPAIEEMGRATGSEELLAVPLVAPDRVLGGLAFSFSEGRHPQKADQDLVLALARQCTQALERARLFDAERSARAEAEAAALRLEVLAEAGALLSTSLDPESALEQLARVCAGTIADYCVAYLLDGEGALRRVGFAHADPDMEPVVRSLQQIAPPQRDDAMGAGAVLRTGEPIFVPYIQDEMLATANQGPEHLSLLLRLRPRSTIIVPLAARDRTVGALAVATVDGGKRPYEASDLTMVEELARLAALTVDTVSLLAEAREASNAKSAFLATVSHELRTPLNGILGYADLLDAEVQGPLTPGQRTQVQRLRRSARHLLTIIEEILSFARIDAGEERPQLEDGVDVAALVQEAAELMEPLARERGLSLVVRVPPDPQRGAMDAPKLRQILLNLLSNAVKFTQHGEIRLSLGATADSWVFSIQDTGVGIPSEDLTRIFEPFVQATWPQGVKGGGTGLGLTVSRELARVLGGDLTVESELGVGSTFTLTLPSLRTSGDRST